MHNPPDYYRILHVHPDAPEEIIRASYRTMMQRLRMHPDLGGDHEQATRINEAFAVLTNPVKRAKYDAEREAANALTTPPVVEATHSAAPPVATPGVEPVCPFCKAGYTGDAITPETKCEACGAPLFAAAHHRFVQGSRRAVDRLPRHVAVAFRRASAAQFVCKGVSQDISLNGMRFHTITYVAPGERLIVTCGFCSAVAVVRSVQANPFDQGGWECGVEFLTLLLRRRRGGLISTVA